MVANLVYWRHTHNYVVLSSFMPYMYHHCLNTRKTKDVIGGTGITSSARALVFTIGFEKSSHFSVFTFLYI
jgi:hypothetical protein